MSDDLKRAADLSEIGKQAFGRGDCLAARGALEEALALRRSRLGDDHLDVASTLDNLGIVARNLGDHAAARNFLERALALKSKALGEDNLEVAATRNNLAVLAMARGDYAAAQAIHKQVLALRQRLLGERHPDVADSLANLGIVGEMLGDFAAARALHEQALAQRREAFGERHTAVAASLDRLGTIAAALGDYGGARDLHEQALALRRSLLGDRHPDVAASLNNLAIVAERLGDYARARALHEEALALRRSVLGERHPTVAASLGYLGTVACMLGDYASARDFYERALALQRGLLGERHPDVAASLGNLGLVAEYLGDYATARRRYEQTLEAMRSIWGEEHSYVAATFANLGNVSAALADHAAARDWYAKALSLDRRVLGADHDDTGRSLVGLANALRALGERQEARGLLGEALRIAQLPQNVQLLPVAYQALSELLAAEGARAAAIFLGKRAVNALQRQRGLLSGLDRELQRSFAARVAQIYRDLAGLLVDAGRLAEAQVVLAMLKEEEFFDVVRRDADSDPRITVAQLTRLEATWQRHGDDIATEIAALSAEENALQAKPARDAAEEARLGALRGLLDAAGRRFDAWLDGLVAAFAADPPERQRDVAALNLQALGGWQADLRELGTGSVLLHYLIRPDRVAIILTTPDFQVSRETSIGERALNRAIHELRLAIEKRTDDLVPLARSLFDHLIRPVASLLAETGAATLMVVLDGPLRYLPFAALHDGEHWLAERYALAMLTPAAHSKVKDAPSAGWRVAGLGVSRDVPGYARLVAVKEELHGIVRAGGNDGGIYPGNIYLDEAFTEAALVEALPGHEAIHIASHFVFAPGDELSSRLLLGDGATLTLERLKDRRFRFGGVELVTLSACETAMGGGREDGREVEGLGALVQNKGAKAVLASLWPVADGTTATLMQRFYAARRDGSSKAEALRVAQLHLMRGTAARDAHPHCWAPFILMGNWL